MRKFVPTAKELAFDRKKFPHGIGLWVFEAKWAHEVWTHYAVSLISLDAKEDVLDVPVKDDPAMTHEIMVLPLAPEVGMPETVDTMVTLAPANHVAQFEVKDDEQARAVASRMIELMEKKHVHPEEHRHHFKSVVRAAAEMELFDLVDRKTEGEVESVAA